MSNTTWFSLPGGSQSKKARGEYKKGEWLWIMTMGVTIGAIATLASSGWLNRLAGSFVSTLIFLMVMYIIVRVGHFKISEIGNFILTIITGGFFWLSDKLIYPFVFQPYVGALVPMELVTIGNISFVTASPGLLIWIPVVSFLLLLGLERHGEQTPPLVGELLAIGIGVFSFTTILAGLFTTVLSLPFNLNAEWALPPLTPLTSFSWWFFGIIYLVLAFGLWFKNRYALYGYAFLQVLGIGVSLFTANWLGLIFNFLILGSLWYLKGQYKSTSFGKHLHF